MKFVSGIGQDISFGVSMSIQRERNVATAQTKKETFVRRETRLPPLLWIEFARESCTDCADGLEFRQHEYFTAVSRKLVQLHVRSGGQVFCFGNKEMLLNQLCTYLQSTVTQRVCIHTKTSLSPIEWISDSRMDNISRRISRAKRNSSRFKRGHRRWHAKFFSSPTNESPLSISPGDLLAEQTTLGFDV